MRVAITGATGFLGTALVGALSRLGYECIVLTRDPRRAAERPWPASVRWASIENYPPAEVVIHLAGESVVGYWTERKRRAILDSRVQGTRSLVAALVRAKTRPHTLLCASAVGIYGHRPGEALDETSPLDPRNGFRAEVCRAWEHEANVAERSGVRVVNLRIGNVIDPSGGYLGGLLSIYRLLGGWMFGNPEAAVPWISLEDAVESIRFALANERWYGPVNLVAPESVTQREFVKGISERLRRRVFGKVPEMLTQSLLGEFASTLVDDQRIVPGKALAAGFGYRHRNFQSWLDAVWPAGAASPSCQSVPIRSES